MSSVTDFNILGRSRVLVVEDEYFIADDMVQAIQKLGGEVVGPVPSVDKALALLDSLETVDAAVLDINLQGDVVYRVADALKQRGIPFVFATGYDKSAVAAEYESVPRWEKPFDPAELARALPGIIRS